MSAYQTTTLLLFPGLGLVALAIGLLSRRYSVSALIAGLAGLLTLATASTWITAAGPRTYTAQIDTLLAEMEKSKTTIAQQRAELEATVNRLGEPTSKPSPSETRLPTAELERLKAELKSEKGKNADAVRNAAEADRRASAETARAADLAKQLRAAEDRVVYLERPQGIQPPPLAAKQPDLASLRRNLADGNPLYYATQKERALIPGKKGAWYVVRLLQGGQDWNFGDRQFVLTDATQIKASAANLRDEVLLPLSQAGKHWRLFARGTADPRRITGPVGRELAILPRLSDETHSPAPRGWQVTVHVENEELPTLRADWLREIVRPLLAVAGASEIEILENPPQPGHGRTAELVLFVEW